MQKAILSLHIAAALVVGSAAPAYSATFDPVEYQSLLTKAGQKQYIRILANLNIDVPLASPDKQLSQVKAQLAAKEAALMAELGEGVLKTGVWKNGLGQMGFYATQDGLKRLAASNNVRQFGNDSTDSLRVGVYDGDGRISNIEAEIEKNGFADVEVVLNLESLDFDIAPNGGAFYKTSNVQQIEAKAKLAHFLDSLPLYGVLNSDQIRQGDILAPSHTMRINKEAFLTLKEHSDVRGLRLANELSSAPQSLTRKFWILPSRTVRLM